MQKLKSVGRYWMVFLGLLIGLAAGFAYTAITPTTYTATSVLFLASPASTDSSGAYQGDLFSQQRATTYVQLFASDDLAVKVIDDLTLKTTPAELKKKVVATQVPKTVLLDVSVADGSAQQAADIANAYAANFNEYVQRLEVPRATGTPTASVNVMNKAEVPTSPSSIKPLLAVAAGVAAGLVVGLAAFWAWRRWRLSRATAAAVETPAVETSAVETSAVATPAVETPAVETPEDPQPALLPELDLEHRKNGWSHGSQEPLTARHDK